MERWAEYYQNLYSTENVITESVLASIPALPVMAELDLPPTEDELNKAIDTLAHGKAPSKDGIPAKVIQCGKPVLLSRFMSYSASIGRRDQYPKTCKMQTLICFIRTRGTTVIVIITGAYPCSALLARHSPEWR